MSAPRYWAFLSYSHADEAAAAKLHRALENYTLPAAVRREHGLPKRLIPVFRDVDELEAAAGLSKRLESALDESRWLVVLCSGASAGSRYVNSEIEYFLKEHGPSRILCVLLDGEPPDCLPPAIRALDDEPLAADLRSGADFDLAVLKLIAAMATVGFTDLRNREAQRRTRQKMLAAAGLAAIGIGAVAYWDFYHRPFVEHFSGYARQYVGDASGSSLIWRGVDPISAETASRRAEYFRFTRRGRLNPPGRVEFLNGSGTCPRRGLDNILGEQPWMRTTWDATRYCSVSFEYSEAGVATGEVFMNDQLVISVDGIDHYNPADRLSLESVPTFVRISHIPTPSVLHDIRQVGFDFDSRGFLSRVRFYRGLGEPQPNADGVFGFHYEHDSEGRLILRDVLDRDFKPLGRVIRFLRTPDGRVAETRHEDAAGRLREGPDGYAFSRHEYDEHGNPVRVSFYAPGGDSAANRDGVATIVTRYDARGNDVETLHFGVSESPVLGREGYAGQQRVFDESGRLLRVINLGRDGQVLARTEFLRDGKGRETERHHYAADGAPMADPVTGCYRYRVTYQAYFHPASEQCLAADGGLMLRTDLGWAVHAYDVPERKESWFDTGGQPLTAKRENS